MARRQCRATSWSTSAMRLERCVQCINLDAIQNPRTYNSFDFDCFIIHMLMCCQCHLSRVGGWRATGCLMSITSCRTCTQVSPTGFLCALTIHTDSACQVLWQDPFVRQVNCRACCLLTLYIRSTRLTAPATPAMCSYFCRSVIVLAIDHGCE